MTILSALNLQVLAESNEKRIKRFFGEVKSMAGCFTRLMWVLLPEKGELGWC